MRKAILVVCVGMALLAVVLAIAPDLIAQSGNAGASGVFGVGTGSAVTAQKERATQKGGFRPAGTVFGPESVQREIRQPVTGDAAGFLNPPPRQELRLDPAASGISAP